MASLAIMMILKTFFCTQKPSAEKNTVQPQIPVIVKDGKESEPEIPLICESTDHTSKGELARCVTPRSV